MDEVNDFFDFSKPFKRVTVSGGYLNGRVISSSAPNASNKIVKREHVGQEYAQSYADAEKLQILKEFEGVDSSSSECQQPSTSSMDTLEDLEEDVKPDVSKPDNELYEKYQMEPKLYCDLPIFDSRTKILNAVRENRCVVLEGDTGCGKTTQVPQYILEDSFQRREYCNIICTQPRRIAAISIAKRVCSEKNCTIGSIVGYQVGLHSNSSEDTRLLYCTTGVLLQKLIKLKKMSQYTHIILDEVHERDQDMDFLLIVIRRFLTTNSPRTKVILMSATINTTEFSDYFTILKGGALVSAPIIKVDTRRLYTVKSFYLCELNKLKSTTLRDCEVNYDEPGISDEMYKIALKLLVVCQQFDKVDEESEEYSYKPSILIFLPGIYEIDHMANTLDTFKTVEALKNLIPIRLHSMISPDEQQKIFIRPPPNHRKIILATNIAESSITVPDVKYVIDFCLTKSLVTDSSTNLTSLQLHWASKASCKQRAGRAGRVMNGRVYRLVSRDYYENCMDEFGIPEMIRCPLETVILKSKLLDIGPPQAILGLAMTPPNLSDIRNTIIVLKETGALLKTISGKYVTYDGDLTFIGRVMAALPIDIRLTRLIIFGYMFSILEETIIIAAGLNVKNIFNYPNKRLLQAYAQKLTWSDGSGSDLFAILKAYRVWVVMKEQNSFEDAESESCWAQRYYINTRSMKEMFILVNELKDRLLRIGIKETTGYDRINWLENEKSIILKIVISGAFYPNYFIRPAQNNVERERDAFHVLCGHDPCNTVYFSNFDNKHIGQLYIQSIKNIFQNALIAAKNIEIKFEYGTQKVFVIFTNDSTDYNSSEHMLLSVPGRVRSEVYKALKLRQLRLPTSIYVMDPSNEITYAEEQGLGLMIDGKWEPTRTRIKHPELVVIPSVFTKTVRGKITHIDHCGKFWFQPLSEIDSLKDITKQINKEIILKFNYPSDISKGMIVAAFLHDSYHRAKVLNVERKSDAMVSFRVFFIDYGNSETVEFSKLRNLKFDNLKDIPPRVFECCLAGIQPSSLNCPTGRWPKQAIELMQQVTNQEMSKSSFVHLEIYSVINSVTSVIMKANNESVNEILVVKGYAQYSEENYMSKMDHDLRMRQQAIVNLNDRKADIIEDYLRSMQPQNEIVIDSLPSAKCKRKLDLRGPFSPLESKVYAAIRIGTWKTVIIEQDSVNSILLDSDPQDSHERLLVSATITENFSRGNLTARQTTVMPNIPGFGPLMALIFCPTMQLRRDKHKTRYVSILCGLGNDKNNKPIFEEHDIVFNLDVEITPKDIETINHIRYSMDTLLATDPVGEMPKITPKTRVEVAAKIKHLIIKLLEKKRKYIEVHHDTHDHIWNEIDSNDILESNNIYGWNAIFPFHTGMRLYNESSEQIDTLRRHCKELHEYRKTNIPLPQFIKCQLCDQCLETCAQLRIHLLSQLHRDREYQIGYAAQI